MPRGFANLDPEKRREISRLGGQSTSKEKRNFARDRELASRAGAKGGRAKKRSLLADMADGSADGLTRQKNTFSAPLPSYSDKVQQGETCLYLWITSAGARARQQEKKILLNTAAKHAGWTESSSYIFCDYAGPQNDDFPQFREAAALCRDRKMRLIIPTIAGLTSNVAFLNELMHSGVGFNICDLPELNRYNIIAVHAVAVQASCMVEKEARRRLARIQAAGRGKNGWSSPLRMEANRAKARAAHTRKSDEYAAKMAPVIDKLLEQGHDSYHALAKALTQANIPTKQGALHWHPNSVSRLLTRMRRSLPETFVSPHLSFEERAAKKETR